MTIFYLQFLSQVVLAMHYNVLNIKEGKMYICKEKKALYYTRKLTFGVLCSPLQSVFCTVWLVFFH